jgi:hypothetical protein
MERRVKVKRYELLHSSDARVRANKSKFVGFFHVTIYDNGETKLSTAVSENSPSGFLDVMVEGLDCCQMGQLTPEEAKKRGWCIVCRHRKENL